MAWDCNNLSLLRIAATGSGSGTFTNLVRKSTGRIVLKESQIPALVEAYYKVHKGVGARKLCSIISLHFEGVSECLIQAFINTSKEGQQANPQFQNKAPLLPVYASEVQERNQIDFTDCPVEVDGFKVRLSVYHPLYGI